MDNPENNKPVPSLIEKIQGFHSWIRDNNEKQESLRKKNVLRAESRPAHISRGRSFCIVCKIPCSDNDITGLTCGNLNCLVALYDIFEKGEFDFKEQEKIKSKILKIRELLGIKSNKTDVIVDLSDLCDGLYDEVNELKKEIDKLASETQRVD